MNRRRAVIALCVGALILLVPWWRNHALLLDFTDYGLVMAAAGRMSLGEQPYVDFLTPIQSLQFFTALWAERLFGAQYLSLTYSNAVFIVGGFAGLFALLRKRTGDLVALLVSAAVIASSALQHTILWYNAMGVVWVALVMWGTAQVPASGRQAAGLLALVWAALWLGGMTKLTYQITAVMFVGALTLRSAWLGEISWRAARVRLWGCLAFGVVAPVATELILTGASLEQWLTNVIVMPAQFRVSMLGQWLGPQFYLQTPHDYYGAWFDFVGLWGVALLILVAAIVVVGKRAQRLPALKEGTLLAVLTGGAWICGAVLLATNMEISYLAGGAWLVMATGIALAVTSRADAVHRSLRIALGGAAVSLLIPAWASAWNGTRALWGHEPLTHPEFVSTKDLPPQFGYIDGLRISPTLEDSFREFAARQEALIADGISPDAFYFVNGTEWMVRVVPEARHPGLPLWLAGGTTFSPGDSWAIAERMKTAEMRALFAHDAWNYWYPGMQRTLDEKFREDRLGLRLFAYVRREPINPVEFAINTSSNVYAGQMTVTGGPLQLHIANNLFLLGGERAHRIDLNYQLYRFEGEIMGELSPGGDSDTSRAVMQVRAREGSRSTDILWEGHLTLSREQPVSSQTFSVSPGDRQISLLLFKPEGGSARFGWRRLYTAHAGPLAAAGPWPMNAQLKRQEIDAAAKRALFRAQNSPVAAVLGFGGDLRLAKPDEARSVLLEGTSEIWLKIERQAGHVAGEFVLDERLWTHPSGVRVTVVCYKSGRFDVMYRRDLYPQTNDADRQPHAFEIWMPEGVGWVGLLTEPLGKSRVLEGGTWWRNIGVW